jgi:hypothetical protein
MKIEEDGKRSDDMAMCDSNCLAYVAFNRSNVNNAWITKTAKTYYIWYLK